MRLKAWALVRSDVLTVPAKLAQPFEFRLLNVAGVVSQGLSGRVEVNPEHSGSEKVLTLNLLQAGMWQISVLLKCIPRI